jgi:hypothetical protein
MDDRNSGTSTHRIRLPGFLVDTEVGAGDVIKRATTRLGIRPCGGCTDRAQRLNSWLAFYGPGRP